MHRHLAAAVLHTSSGLDADQCTDRTREARDVGDTIPHQKARKLHASHLFVGKFGEDIVFTLASSFALLLGEERVLLHPTLPYGFHLTSVGICEQSAPVIAVSRQVACANAQGNVQRRNIDCGSL